MEDEKEMEKSCCAWIDRKNCIVSFQYAEGLEKLQFPTHEEMFAYVIRKSLNGFRIQ